jgi:hypothetical protein
MATPDLSGEAETLVRALAGVTFARIDASRDGIEAIHVTARDADAARHMAAHVRSALLAGLATPVLPGRIHVRVADAGPGPRDAAVEPPRPDPDPDRHRIRVLEEPGAQAAHDDSWAEAATAPTGAAAAAGETRAGPAVAAAPDELHTVTGRPRLVAVDVDRPGDGRVLCRVAVAYQTRVHRAEAVAVDLPGAAAQAASQAAVRALIDAGIPGLELHGLREVEIAGRDYVLVALRQRDTFPRTRSGSVPIIGSPERSAAEATVAAANMII